ncbi:MAG: hypothetical protein DHS20C11_15160 [Lysobacteraceae bacterium]|nr:MAG: hypothetical protein DHS20C11_15160 [Xanthomonadaceae bacterium]
MLTFLKIVLAVILVIVAILVIAFLLFKRWITRVGERQSNAYELIDRKYQQPARVRLRRTQASCTSKEFDDKWSQCARLGFIRLADFDDSFGGLELLRAGGHSTLPLSLVLTDSAEEEVHFAMFFITQDLCLEAVSDGPEPAIRSKRLTWSVDPSLALEDAIAKLRTKIEGVECQKPDIRLIRNGYEQAYATRMDHWLQRPPTLDEFQALASTPKHDEEAVRTAHELAVGLWQDQVRDAVIDRYRRSSQMDATSWERIVDDIDVVYGHLSGEDITNMLGYDDTCERIVGQLSEQGLAGIDLYDAAASRLPPEYRRVQLGEVRLPLRSVLYIPDEDASEQAAPVGAYLYSGQADTGETVHGSIVASNAGDAKQQLARLGVKDQSLLGSPEFGGDENMPLDPDIAAYVAKAMYQSTGRAMLSALAMNWLIWAPPALLICWSLVEGKPYGWGDYAGFAYGIAAALLLVGLIAPATLYTQLQSARVHGRRAGARRFVSLLEHWPINGIPKTQLHVERCKILAEEGKLAEAEALLDQRRGEMSHQEYLSAQIQIFGEGGDFERMIAVTRTLVAEYPGGETAPIELALALARYTDEIEESVQILHSISRLELPEIAIIGYDFALGVTALKRGDNEKALGFLSRATKAAEQFKSLPLMTAMVAEMSGYAALAYRQLGQTEKADDLWASVEPLLRRHRSCQPILDAYAAACG